MAVEELLEEGDEEGWEVDVAGGACGFGWAEVEAPLDFVEGPVVGIDADEAVAEAGVGAGESGEFAPAHAGVGGGGDEDLVGAAFDASGDGVDLGGGGRWAFGSFAA
ncbi:hypothetical protein ABGB07_45610 [Micromonosporaceae bacterium B7E4]